MSEFKMLWKSFLSVHSRMFDGRINFAKRTSGARLHWTSNEMKKYSSIHGVAHLLQERNCSLNYVFNIDKEKGFDSRLDRIFNYMYMKSNESAKRKNEKNYLLSQVIDL